ncbi:MAG: hypothetical protein AVDCRST_MAG77-1784, partial [uncultured Chloroflexi bacterium]
WMRKPSSYSSSRRRCSPLLNSTAARCGTTRTPTAWCRWKLMRWPACRQGGGAAAGGVPPARQGRRPLAHTLRHEARCG